MSLNISDPIAMDAVLIRFQGMKAESLIREAESLRRACDDGWIIERDPSHDLDVVNLMQFGLLVERLHGDRRKRQKWGRDGASTANEKKPTRNNELIQIFLAEREKYPHHSATQSCRRVASEYSRRKDVGQVSYRTVYRVVKAAGSLNP